MKQKDDKYRLSFTACSLRPSESALMATLYLQIKDWDAVVRTVLTENLLQARLHSTLKRITLELRGRLQTLTDTEITYLTTCDPQNRAYLLWIAVCRYYPFIAEFAVEVMRENFFRREMHITMQHFNSFFYTKADDHAKLHNISDQTRGKLRQVIFKMLKETMLISTKNEIKALHFTSEFVQLLRAHSIKDIQYFPVHPEDIIRSQGT